MSDMREAFERIDRLFVSGNSIPVERVIITKEMWDGVKAWQAARAKAPDMTHFAEKKISEMGGTPCGLLVRNEAGALAAVSDLGRVTWLDDCVMGPESSGVGAKEIIDRVISELEGGFVACSRCGDQEDTATLDCMGDLKQLQSILSVCAQGDAEPVTPEDAPAYLRGPGERYGWAVGMNTRPNTRPPSAGVPDSIAALEALKSRIASGHVAMAPTAERAVGHVLEAIRLEIEARTPMFQSSGPSAEVPEGLAEKALELCNAVENKEGFPPAKFALRCLMLVNQVRELAGQGKSQSHASAGVPEGCVFSDSDEARDFLSSVCKPEYSRYIRDGKRLAGDFACHIASLLATPAPAAASAEWVKCEERLPTDSGAGCDGSVWFTDKSGDGIQMDPILMHWSYVTKGSGHWAPTGLKRPQPPKQEGE
ncbi:MAG: hypothetical protein ACI92B_001488 [Marinobacter maritimus]|jgi:hypothetical protein